MVFPINRRLIAFGVGLIILGILLWQVAIQDEWRLFALDASTGRVQWSASVDQADNPVVSGGRVFLTTYPGKDQSGGIQRKLMAFDASSGKSLWEFAPKPGQVIETLAASPETVIVCFSGDRQVAVLDAAAGTLRGTLKQVWCNAPDQFGMTITGNRLVAIIQTEDNKLALQAYDARTLAVLWHTALPMPSGQALEFAFAPLLVASDQLVIAKDGAQLDVVDLQTGTLQQRLAKIETSADLSRLRLIGSDLYRSAFDTLTDFDVTSGSSRWTFKLPKDRIIATLEATPQTIYVMDAPLMQVMVGSFDAKAGEQNWLIALDARTGQERWRKPLVAGGTLNTPALRAWATTGEDAIFASGILQNRVVLLAFASQDGAERWRFPLSGGFYQAPAADGTRVFVTDSAPRWRNWLAGINPAWR